MRAAGAGRLCALALAGMLPASAGAQRAALADFARPDAGARVTALAGAAVAAPAGTATAAWNPAALVGLTRGEFGFEHRGAGPGLTLESGSLTLAATRRLDVAMRAHVLRRDGVAAPEAIGGARGTPTLSGYLGGVIAALHVGRGVHVGAGLGRVAGFPAGNTRPSAWSLDVGVHAQRGSFRAGAATRGLLFQARHADPNPDSWSAGFEAAVPRTRFGIAMHVAGTGAESVSGGTALLYRAARALELRAGARLRAGAIPVFGAGAAFGARAARLEYGARLEAGVGTQHVLAVQLGFGGASLAGAMPPRSTTPTRREDTAPSVPARAPQSAPPAPAPPQPVAPASPAVDARFTVVAGPYPSLEAAARDVNRLREAGLRPAVEHRGKQVVLVLLRGADGKQAHALAARARPMKISIRIETE